MASQLPNELDRQLAGSDIAVQSLTVLGANGVRGNRQQTLVLTAAPYAGGKRIRRPRRIRRCCWLHYNSPGACRGLEVPLLGQCQRNVC